MDKFHHSETHSNDPAALQEILAANAAFYRAFSSGNYDAMDSLWSSTAPVSCIHPGWPPVQGRHRVMQTWRGILAEPPQPPIQSLEEDVMLHGETGLVVCFEVIGDLYLAASNLFILENGDWRLVHHQSGQTEKIPKSLMEQSTRSLH